MSFEIQPSAVRAAWADGAGEAREGLAGSAGDRSAARGNDLGELAAAMAGAGDVIDGVTSTTLAVLGELHTALESNLATYARTDDAAALSFPVLTAPADEP